MNRPLVQAAEGFTASRMEGSSMTLWVAVPMEHASRAARRAIHLRMATTHTLALSCRIFMTACVAQILATSPVGNPRPTPLFSPTMLGPGLSLAYAMTTSTICERPTAHLSVCRILCPTRSSGLMRPAGLTCRFTRAGGQCDRNQIVFAWPFALMISLRLADH